MDNKGLKKFPYKGPDGAVGYITDVTQEHFYKEPDIGLYDELEEACYELVCDFADLIGVHLDKNEPDFRLANHIRDTVIELLENEFSIPFPVYGETNEELNARLLAAKTSFIAWESSNEDMGQEAKPELMFIDNEECALALYEYLKKTGKIEGSEYDRVTILHDINNLRGNEWLDLLPLNTETKAFFMYLSPEPVVFHGDGAVLEDTFICDDSIAPEFYWFLATGEKGEDIFEIEELRTKLDEANLGDVWDYCMADIAEAVENNEHLVIVEPYAPSKEECRIFEVTADMFGRYQAYMAEKNLDQTDFSGDRPKAFDLFDVHSSLSSQIKCAHEKLASSKDEDVAVRSDVLER